MQVRGAARHSTAGPRHLHVMSKSNPFSWYLLFFFETSFLAKLAMVAFLPDDRRGLEGSVCSLVHSVSLATPHGQRQEAHDWHDECDQVGRCFANFVCPSTPAAVVAFQFSTKLNGTLHKQPCGVALQILGHGTGHGTSKKKASGAVPFFFFFFGLF